MTTQRTCWVVIPAAGIGTRMGGQIPKQYLPLAGKTIIEHTLDRFRSRAEVAGIVVVLSANDTRWKTLPPSVDPNIHTTVGGEQRFHSVLNGLRYLEKMAKPDDLVMIHDAARPCVRKEDISTLISKAETYAGGAILAMPARDTMKRAKPDGTIDTTVNRDALWHALTPQIFRLETICKALEEAIKHGNPVTDDAQALELIGLHPLLVEGHADNIKITGPADLKLAEIYLTQQEKLV